MSILDFPNEILYQILQKLSIEDLDSFLCTNSKLNSHFINCILNDVHFWKKKLNDNNEKKLNNNNNNIESSNEEKVKDFNLFIQVLNNEKEYENIKEYLLYKDFYIRIESQYDNIVKGSKKYMTSYDYFSSKLNANSKMDNESEKKDIIEDYLLYHLQKYHSQNYKFKSSNNHSSNNHNSRVKKSYYKTQSNKYTKKIIETIIYISIKDPNNKLLPGLKFAFGINDVDLNIILDCIKCIKMERTDRAILEDELNWTSGINISNVFNYKIKYIWKLLFIISFDEMNLIALCLISPHIERSIPYLLMKKITSLNKKFIKEYLSNYILPRYIIDKFSLSFHEQDRNNIYKYMLLDLF